MAAIGSVNPRSGGLLNTMIQAVKRVIARSLSWFVRDQVTFNRQTVACIEAAMEAMNEMNSSLSILAGEFNARVSLQHAHLPTQLNEWNVALEGNLRQIREETAKLKQESSA